MFDRRRFADDQRGAARGPARIIGRIGWRQNAVLCRTASHRGHDETIVQRQPADAKGREQRRRVDRLMDRSEEHTSELQSLMRISYAVFCLKKTKHIKYTYKTQ